MSLYREAGRRRRRRMVAGATAAVLVLAAVLAIVLLAGGDGGASPAARRADARAAAQTARDGLELLGIEYEQAVRGGRIVAATEYEAAKADVDRARTALDEHREDFPRDQAGDVDQVDAVLTHIGALVRQRADPATVGRERRRADQLLLGLTR